MYIDKEAYLKAKIDNAINQLALFLEDEADQYWIDNFLRVICPRYKIFR